jgi:Xaa-Pro aminopeptidase
MKHMAKNRIMGLRELLTPDMDALLILKPENRAYISGFTGSAGYLVISREEAFMLTDFRYVEQAIAQCPQVDVSDYAPSLYDSLNERLSVAGIRRLAFEGDYVTHATHQTLSEKLSVDLVPSSGLVEKLRMVKDEGELSAMQKAAEIAESALHNVTKMIRPGVRELEVAIELEISMRRMGSEGLPFGIIAASGPRSSLPHGRASERTIYTGDFLTLDFGAMYNGYCCDITRTFIVGKASPEQERIYNTVLKAQLGALNAIKPGILGKEVDRAARDIIEEAGYGDRFGHGLGHGVGRLVHEGPSAGSKSEDILAPGNVITAEPGIYIPEWGGVRIEDMVVVTETGHRNFNSYTKELVQL